MQRLRTVTSLDVCAVAGHHAMPAALLFIIFSCFFIKVLSYSSNKNHNKYFIEYEYEEIHLFMILYLDLGEVLILLNTLLVVVVSSLLTKFPRWLSGTYP